MGTGRWGLRVASTPMRPPLSRGTLILECLADRSPCRGEEEEDETGLGLFPFMGFLKKKSKTPPKSSHYMHLPTYSSGFLRLPADPVQHLTCSVLSRSALHLQVVTFSYRRCQAPFSTSPAVS